MAPSDSFSRLVGDFAGNGGGKQPALRRPPPASDTSSRDRRRTGHRGKRRHSASAVRHRALRGSAPPKTRCWRTRAAMVVSSLSEREASTTRCPYLSARVTKSPSGSTMHCCTQGGALFEQATEQVGFAGAGIALHEQAGSQQFLEIELSLGRHPAPHPCRSPPAWTLANRFSVGCDPKQTGPLPIFPHKGPVAKIGVVVIPLVECSGVEPWRSSEPVSWDFADAVVGKSGNSTLNRLEELVRWYRFEKLLSKLRDNGPGRAAWPPLVLFKALLLGALYGLSERELEEALSDRLSFRRFCGLGLEEGVPDHTACSTASATSWWSWACSTSCSTSSTSSWRRPG